MRNSRTIPALLTAIGLSVAAAWAETEPIVLMSPTNYQVLAISPNGQWATGIFSDNSMAQRGFLWNLQSNTFELLSTNEESQGWTVANNGTVCGSFTDHRTSDIGAGTIMPGYYRDGEWHGVEIPQGFSGPEDNYHGAGQGYAISADGTVMAGALYINGNFSPAVWKEGQLVELLNISNNGMQGGAPYCISPDGTLVGGWSYRNNRSCTLWNLNNGTRTFISEEQSPWASVNRFSPDGKKVIYGGGWDMSIDPEAEVQYYYSIYDIETGEATSLPARDNNSTVSIFGISNSYTCVGSTGDYDTGLAIIYPNGAGPAILLEDYLTERGVDFEPLELPIADEDDHKMIFRGADISADDNILALLAYGQEGLCSIIVMLNQDSEHAAPQEVKARQLSGISTSQITWNAPVRAAEGIEAYRIYRNEELIAELPADVYSYYDSKLDYTTYLYNVSSLYSDGTEMMASAPSLTVAPLTVARPEGFSVRQKGVYSIKGEWDTPGTNLVCKSYFTPATANLRGFGIGADDQTIEVGIGFKKEEMANYLGYSISKVNFYPMSEQESWKVNIYQYDGDTPVCIYSQPVTQDLIYKHRNAVVLDQPVPVTADGDLVIAIEVTVPVASMNVIGMDYGHNYPGYSDLIRTIDDPDFYSYYYTTMEYGVADYANVMIEAVLTAEGQDLTCDEVCSYRLTLDGQEVLNEKALSWTSDKVSQDKHTLSLQAVFADGKVSDPVSAEVNVSYKYKSIDNIDITNNGSKVNLAWEAPVDDDLTTITYAHGTAQNEGIIGPEENDYYFMAGVQYDQTLLVGYEGYTIQALRFFPTANATFTFSLYDDTNLIADIPVETYELDTWNVVALPEPIQLIGNTSYLLVLECYEPEAGLPPLAIDNRLPLAFTSDLISVDGMSWSSITVESGLAGNWMMGIDITDPASSLLPVDGYEVRIDGTKVADRMTETSLTYDLGEDAVGSHTARVNTFYTGRATAVNGSLITFVIDADVVALQALSQTYHLSRGTDYLSIEGTCVQQVSLFSADGKVAAHAKGNKVAIASLPAGIYMVKAVAVGRELNYKVVID